MLQRPLIERFLEKFMADPNSGCWLWTAGVTPKGYGRIHDGGLIFAHRASFQLFKGRIPDGLCVLHRCDTPPCVNPDHLFLGTVADNNADRDRKGRGADVGGEKHSMAKLTAAKVVEIRRRYDAGESQTALGREFGVSRAVVGRIVHGKMWKSRG